MDAGYAHRYVQELITDARAYLAEHGQPAHRGSLAEQDAAAAQAFDAAREWIADRMADAPAHFAAADALESARTRQREIAGRWLADDAADLIIQADQLLEAIEA